MRDAMTTRRSITETPNFLTSDIDLASPLEIVRILRQADGQLFSGYLKYAGMFDAETFDTLERLARRTAAALRRPDGRVILSGAGTSGRLAMVGARVFNRALGCPPDAPVFRYLMAGGDPALIQAQEGAEDSATQGVADLEAAAGGAGDVIFVGTTCGFSAPYIGGQIDACLGRDDRHAVLLGFNPVELARCTLVEGWDKTFLEIAQAMQAHGNADILNPVLGPEPVTGSTRMKSGSATKILLEVLFLTSIALAQGRIADAGLRRTIIAGLLAYEDASRSVFLRAEAIGRLVEAGGATLRAHGRICYLGDASGTAGGGDTGILGLIDASECPPTFGARFEDVRGFLLNGWRGLFPDGSVDLSARDAHYRISLDDFRRDKLPGLGANDLCVTVGDFAGRDELLAGAKARGAVTAAISWAGGCAADIPIVLEAEPHPLLGDGPLELQVKLVLNALTTGAHILAGKVFGNRMVDLRISNNKLFHRTVGIIGDLMRVDHDRAVESLLCAVFETDSLTDAQRETPISECIERAKNVDKVVPKALLLASGRFTCAQAAKALERNPIVRSLLADLLA